MAYDQDNYSFAVNRLPGEKEQINPQLVAFYKKFKSAEVVDTPEIHREWIKIVANVPGVTYLMAVDENGKVEKEGELFIHGISDEYIEDKKEIEVGGKKFIAVNPEKYSLTELLLNKSSVTVLFNYLFNLELFENPREAYEKDLFPLLCEKMGWILDGEKEEEAYITLTIDAGKGRRFNLRMSVVHGETVPLSDVFAFDSRRKKLFDLFFVKKDRSVIDLSLMSLYSKNLLERSGKLDHIPDEFATMKQAFQKIQASADDSLLFEYFYMLYPSVFYVKYFRGLSFALRTDSSQVLPYIAKEQIFFEGLKRLILAISPEYLHEGYHFTNSTFEKVIPVLLEKGTESQKAMIVIGKLGRKEVEQALELLEKLRLEKVDAASKEKLILKLLRLATKKLVREKPQVYLKLLNFVFTQLIENLSLAEMSLASIDTIIFTIFYPYYDKERAGFSEFKHLHDDIKKKGNYLNIFFDLIEKRYGKQFDAHIFNKTIFRAIDENEVSKLFTQRKKAFLLKHKEKLGEPVLCSLLKFGDVDEAKQKELKNLLLKQPLLYESDGPLMKFWSQLRSVGMLIPYVNQNIDNFTEKQKKSLRDELEDSYNFEGGATKEEMVDFLSSIKEE